MITNYLTGITSNNQQRTILKKGFVEFMYCWALLIIKWLYNLNTTCALQLNTFHFTVTEQIYEVSK